MHVRSKNIIMCSVFAWGVILTACSPVKVASIQEYKLESPSTLHVRNKPTRATILVSKPLAASGYTTSDMRYVVKSYELSSFAKNSWVAPPADMLETMLIESLQNSGYFYGVVRAPFAGTTAYRLDTQLLSLRQNFLKRPSRIDLAIKAELVNETTKKIVRSKRFVTHVNALEDTPYGGVMAANRAMNNLMVQIVRFATDSVPFKSGK